MEGCSEGIPDDARPRTDDKLWQRRQRWLIPAKPWWKNVPHLLTSTTNNHTLSAEADWRGGAGGGWTGWCGLRIYISVCAWVSMCLYPAPVCYVCMQLAVWGTMQHVNQSGRCENRGSAAVKMNKEENCHGFVFGFIQLCSSLLTFLLFSHFPTDSWAARRTQRLVTGQSRETLVPPSCSTCDYS